MIKYIASDLDGTLLQNGAQELPPEIFDLIPELKEKGIHFIAASGRQYYNMRDLFKPVQDDISYIAENGSLCVHNRKVISRGLIERGLGLRIIEASRTIPSCSCTLSGEIYTYTDSADSGFLDHLHNVLHYYVKEVPDLTDVEEPFLKLAMYDSNGTGKTEAFFKERFSSEISVVTSGNLWVDFIAPGANKGTALDSVARHLGFLPKDGIAFGDQYNDIEMLQAAGTGYAMKNCAPGVEKYADRQTDSVIRVIRKLLKS